ncbi:MAG: class A beta-lactamase-related serine hydrolase [Winogradskyella sp.]|nr:MAG: class A beta-lactamase-related serine hydrolase [Winogradskyella sp.]
MRITYILALLVIMFSCSSTESITPELPNDNSEVYFPPLNSDVWDTISPNSLGWNTSKQQDLLDFLESSDTESFIILENGKIALEAYFNGANNTTNNPWFSAGKTLAAFMVGVAEQENLLDINDSSNQYLGLGWSSTSLEQENAITVKNHITMSTGLDYNVSFDCTNPECLSYLGDSDTFWYYHNAPYSLTREIVSGAVDTNFNTYFDQKLKSKIGMNGTWIPFGFNTFYFSTARSMARFGLLCYNKGVWNEAEILNESFFNEMTNSSQNLNPAYGYLWWLNGKTSYVLPGSPSSFNGKLIPNAPDDLIAGLGANDQKLYIVPSKKLVIIRMGGDANEGQLGPSGYDNALWEKLSALIN